MELHWIVLLIASSVSAAQEDYKDLLGATEVAKTCTGRTSLMIGSSCFTLHFDYKNFTDAFEDCKKHKGRLAHFYTKSTWSAFKNFIETNLGEITHHPWIGLRRASNKQPNEFNYHWLRDNIDEFFKTCYADQENIAIKAPVFTHICGKVIFHLNRIGTGHCEKERTYICEKVVPMQQFVQIAHNKKSSNSVFVMTKPKINDHWFCGLDCLREEACVAFNYWPMHGGGCQLLFKFTHINDLVDESGFSYHQRLN